MSDKRRDWETRIGRRIQMADLEGGVVLDAPKTLVATVGRGQVTLSWSPVDGAAGYTIWRREGGGETKALDHGGSDVLAVPHPPYADTSVVAGQTYWYSVSAISTPEAPPGPRCENVEVTAASVPEQGPRSKDAPTVSVEVDAARRGGPVQPIWHMVGSERLAQLRFGDDGNGNLIGPEFAEALRIARDELGVTMLRSHGIFHDELGVYKAGESGSPTYDFSSVDSLFDQLLSIGIRPVVELGFMPADLALDPSATVFEWHGIISPPKDWGRWAELNAALAGHLVERYGIDEVAQWAFEVWNEANLEVFWTGTKEEYFRLYREAAVAIKGVDGRLRVGGPGTAASEWLESFVSYLADRDLPLDFLSTHTYGNLPIDPRPILGRHGFGSVPIWWTEWGVGSTHFGPVHDTVFGAPFVLRGMKSAQGRLDALAYWVISDHFGELGRPPRLFHNGFGLLSVGNLRKPRYWALRMVAGLGPQNVGCKVSGDGAGSLVDAWATTTAQGRIDVLVWNGAADASRFGGVADLARTVDLTVTGLGQGPYEVHVARIDEEHSNIVSQLPSDVDWPDPGQWASLRKADRLDEHRLADVSGNGTKLSFVLPMPGVLRLRLIPQDLIGS